MAIVVTSLTSLCHVALCMLMAAGSGRQEPGSSLDDAYEFGTNRTFTGQVVGNSAGHYFSFELTEPKFITITLDQLSAAADVLLGADMDQDGLLGKREVIRESRFNRSTKPREIHTSLTPGRYYVKVSSNETAGYRLAVRRKKVKAFEEDVGNSLAEAHDLGTLEKKATARDVIGTTDREDVYRFSLETPMHVGIALSDLSDEAQIQLGADLNGTDSLSRDEILRPIESRSQSGKKDRTMTAPLSPGIFYIRVFAHNVAINSPYTLRVSATPIKDRLEADPMDNAMEAHDLGTLASVIRISDLVGAFDEMDIYRFTMTNPGNITVTLSDLVDNLSARLIHDKDGDAIMSPAEILDTLSRMSGTAARSLKVSIQPGTYFVQVYPANKTHTSTYTLRIAGHE